MKIVLVGLGKIGTCIVKQLTVEEHELVCIDSNTDSVSKIVNDYDVMGIAGSGTDYNTLRNAGVKEADLFIAVSPKDEINIVSCLLAKKLGAKKTIARIRDPQLHSHIALLKDDMGVDYPLNPEFETAKAIEKVISLPSAVSVDSFANDKADIIAYTIKEDSLLRNMALKTVNKKFDGKVLFITVQRNNETFIPNGDFILKEKDVVYLLGERLEIIKFLDSIGDAFKKLKNVLIIGGGITGGYLTNDLLKTKHNVKVIETNKDRCYELNNLYPKAAIINADGTSQDLLIREGIKETDTIVSLCNLDEENILIGMFAQRVEVPKIIIKVNKDSLTNMIKDNTDMSIITAKEVTADIVLSIVRFLANKKGSSVTSVNKLIKDEIEAIQFRINNKCKLINIPLKDIKIKSDNLIGCILRGQDIIIPNGNDVILEGDEVMIITKDFKVETIEQLMR